MNREEFEARMYNLHNREMAHISGDLLNISPKGLEAAIAQMTPNTALEVLAWMHKTESQRENVTYCLARRAHDDPT